MNKQYFSIYSDLPQVWCHFPLRDTLLCSVISFQRVGCRRLQRTEDNSGWSLVEKGAWQPRHTLQHPWPAQCLLAGLGLLQVWPWRTLMEALDEPLQPLPTRCPHRFSLPCHDLASLTKESFPTTLPARVSDLRHHWPHCHPGHTCLSKQKMLLCVNVGFSAADGNSLWF